MEKIFTFTNIFLDTFLFGFLSFGHRYGDSLLDWRTNLDGSACGFCLGEMGLGGRCDNHEEMLRKKNKNNTLKYTKNVHGPRAGSE
jgi:hypothetical protein